MDCDYSYKIMPKIDQSSVYKNVWDHLSEDGAIGIFPEGGSHDNSEFFLLYKLQEEILLIQFKLIDKASYRTINSFSLIVY